MIVLQYDVGIPWQPTYFSDYSPNLQHLADTAFHIGVAGRAGQSICPCRPTLTVPSS